MKQLKTLMISPLLLVSAVSHAGLFGSDKTIKIGHYFAESHPQHIALQQFEKEVEEKTNGDIDVKIFPNAQLGSEEQLINGMRNGTIEVALFGSLMQSLDPRLGFTETPFLIRNYDHARKVLDSDVGTEIAGVFEEFGVKHLAYSVSGFRVISSNKKIEKPEDYGGLRMRVPNVAMFLEMAGLLGVNGQAMAFTEVFTALEQGVVDAQENPMSLIKAQGFYEVQKYIIETNHMFTSLNLGINKAFFEGLTAEQQKVVTEAAAKYSTNSWQAVVKDNDATKAFFVEQGVEVITPSDELVKWNQDAMKPLYQNMFKRHPWAEDMTNRVRAQ
ncbi:putative TRAP-type C4-dicarboxylate transport system, periplasmic component [Vibrio nigripulchritudo MADA3029]|uniref:TRAP-type C4-dicarboxylate transport system, periplasmic component n=1 Tax=Vibrio nigripulchritudo SOn1 TaxID=1238450 RepID=A0AAV2VSU2_9VIBR|nr:MULTISPECIES: TRAP transporter substrate-binding protein [Vibrio]EGU57660.1 C4-dicarboxylate transport system C4-dicarboxylate-binding protein [Vibrio nigripulchritudo ATCC 27043]UAB73142.1 TRAP transporter substrate-binding protein [Vibrio sp. SCSIO 43132]CCN35759.1 putative TRAP-type C4-dicarboxylate transport system, periplasmic component [Vibrio nigripulchritudo AM115]CCN44682.1 putative TRAP-type C4-dicarboxylate transport system, periplasmic component [Vibrio nigripulchritudo FTn2]CCN